MARIDYHPGRAVVIGSLSVGTDAVSGECHVRSTADDLAGGFRVTRADDSYVIINANDGGASAAGIIQAGDGAQSRALKLNPFGAVVEVGAGGLSVAGGGASIAGAVTITGLSTLSGGMRASDGSAASPSMSFASGTGIGFYREPSSFMRFADAGIPTFEFALDDFRILSRARGTGNLAGAQITIGRNTSGNGAPGTINLVTRTGANAILWIDSTGLYRGDTFAPTEVGGDTGGTVLGTQTSQRSTKDITRQVTDAAGALDLMRHTPVFEFTYKNGSYNGQSFIGITTDDSPEFGMDRGRSFNPVSAFGYTVLALQEIARRLDVLEATR